MKLNLSKILALILVGLGAITAPGLERARADTPATSPTTTITFRVEGMHCASCGVAVRTALKKLNGVKDAKVNGDRATVEYDPAKVTPKALADKVKDLGYDAVLPAAQSR